MLTGGALAGVEIKTEVDLKVAQEFVAKVDANLKDAADHFQGILVPKLPVDEGTLKKTARVRRIRPSKKNPGGGYRVDAEFYLFFYEYGTQTEKGETRQPARPVVNPLLQANEDKIQEIITKDLLA